jgi:agmatinase
VAHSLSPLYTFLDDEHNPSPEEALVHYLGVSCDLTASYHKGAFRGSQAILEASWQIEYQPPLSSYSLSERVPIHHQGILDYSTPSTSIEKTMDTMVQHVSQLLLPSLQQDKFILLTGGDHSIPNGLFQAMTQCYSPKDVTVLHLDAHLDLREALGGYHYSHGSIMRRVREAGFRVIHVGIRDHIGDEEREYIEKTDLWPQIFFCATQAPGFYERWKTKIPVGGNPYTFGGELQERTIQRILQKCNTPYYWISLDVDGIDPKDMPGTGTPLPHGLSLASTENLLYQFVQHLQDKQHKLLGMDLTEVSPQMQGSPEAPYQVAQVLSNQTEQNAALLLYKVLLWNYAPRFFDSNEKQ